MSSLLVATAGFYAPKANLGQQQADEDALGNSNC